MVQWLPSYIVPNCWPAPYILVASLRLDGVAPDMSGPISVSSTDLTVKFPREAFANRAGGTYNLSLTGLTANGASFSGSTSLNVQGSTLASKKRALRPLAIGPAGSG